MKFLFLFFIFWSFVAFSQDGTDLEVLKTERTSSSPFSIPLSVSSNGEIHLFDHDEAAPLNFQPAMQIYTSLTRILYSAPILSNSFEFSPLAKDSHFIEVRTMRLEAGLGLSTLVKSTMNVGLVPFTGALHTLIRYKDSDLESSLPLLMPKTLKEVEEWKTNDTGTYQRFGGVTFIASFPSGIFHVAAGEIGIQNLFLIKIQKISHDEVSLTISEEHLNRKILELGPFLSEADFGFFNGKKFSATFILHPSDPEHHLLFSEGIRGNLKALQDKLPVENRALNWTGRDNQLYIGIPTMLGRNNNVSHYDFTEDGKEAKLDIHSASTTGILLPLRNYQNYAYATDTNMAIVWSSEMNRATGKVVDKHFLSIGRAMKVSGLSHQVPRKIKFGSVVSHLALTVSKKEVETFKDMNFDEVRAFYQARCEEEELPCKKQYHAEKALEKVRELLGRPWSEMKKELGFLLMKEPALIYAIMKTTKTKKTVYFKFLSEKFQSLEGSSSIELE